MTDQIDRPHNIWDAKEKAESAWAKLRFIEKAYMKACDAVAPLMIPESAIFRSDGTPLETKYPALPPEVEKEFRYVQDEYLKAKADYETAYQQFHEMRKEERESARLDKRSGRR